MAMAMTMMATSTQPTISQLNINFDNINMNMDVQEDESVNSIGLDTPSNVKLLNTHLNNNSRRLNNAYIATKFLGTENNNNLYLLRPRNITPQNSNYKYICKQINIPSSNRKMLQQIKFEIELLKYLSFKKNTSDYINPCIDSIIDKTNVVTIFPVFNGSSLPRYKSHMMKELNDTEYTNLALLLCKNLLLGLGAIHHNNIAHQNIIPNSIVISTDDVSHINVKYTDFVLGCGNYFEPGDTTKNIREKCDISRVPVKIDSSILSTLGASNYLDIAIKNDIWRLGIILLELLLPDENIIMENREKMINYGWTTDIEQMCSGLLAKYYNSLTEEQRENDKLSYYIWLILNTMIRPVNMRKSCKYVVDKIIVFEKYIGEDFSV